ncbi:MAG: methyltransferase domain-containing protein [Candidatus Lokiarchaeota archaeon]|nr:methyltransferase domain-containing protein [Candidatus Lokiarchaeota archaeon]MBD3340696.1 methyltransferase domain-containing protein [Candidatus Lokiarchaeota archaeon]
MNDYYFDNIAKDYDLKRKKPWRALKRYIANLRKGGISFKGINLDLGCANGRNFPIFLPISSKIIGIDKSHAFLKITLERVKKDSEYSANELKRIQLVLADIEFLPIRKNSINNVFSIATIHHVKGESSRKNVIFQIFTIMKRNGYFLLTLWRRWQKKFKKFFLTDRFKRIFSSKYKKMQINKELGEFGDISIPWTVSPKSKTYYRFYHLFSKKEAKNLLSSFTLKDFKKYGGPTGKDNFFILTKKEPKKKN